MTQQILQEILTAAEQFWVWTDHPAIGSAKRPARWLYLQKVDGGEVVVTEIGIVPLSDGRFHSCPAIVIERPAPVP